MHIYSPKVVQHYINLDHNNTELRLIFVQSQAINFLRVPKSRYYQSQIISFLIFPNETILITEEILWEGWLFENMCCQKQSKFGIVVIRKFLACIQFAILDQLFYKVYIVLSETNKLHIFYLEKIKKIYDSFFTCFPLYEVTFVQFP